MSGRAELTKKQLNHLLTLGTLLLANKELIELIGRLREKYKINPLEKEWNPNYKEELESSGKLAAIKEEIINYFARSYIEDDEENEGTRKSSALSIIN